MAMRFGIKSGDRFPPIVVVLQDAAGRVRFLNPLDTVTFRMTPVLAGLSPDVSAPATIVDAAHGIVSWDWPVGAPVPGLYRGEFFVANDGDPTVGETFPGGDEYIDIVVGHIAAADA